MGKRKIFISHSTPSDNYFAAWLASKLKSIGYEVWIELDELKSGDAFWSEIENAIRNDSIKFLVIISREYMERINDPYSGIFKELSCADRIRIDNFKTPIRIDEIDFDTFPVQIMGLNSIDFYKNWQTGLDNLIDSLIKEKIFFDESKKENPLNFWLDSFRINDVLNTETEKIYTNWFPFILPTKLYVHKYILDNRIDLVDIEYPYLDYSDRHISFFPASDYPSLIKTSSSVEFVIENMLNEYFVPVDEALILTEPRKKIIELVNKTVSHFFSQMKMKKYAQSNIDVFYFSNTYENRKRISLKSIGKNNVSVTGKTGQNFWSFGISANSALYPIAYIKIASHIIFEDNNLQVIDQEEQHTLRRKYGFDWYNKDWLDTLIGIMMKISGYNSEGKMLVPISSSEKLVIDSLPYNIDTNFGYDEPIKIETDAE